jgi:hypothetical protein
MKASLQRPTVGRDVAALTFKTTAARSDAAVLRREAAALRWTTKLIVRESRQRRDACLLSYRCARRLRFQPLFSPWSTLLWNRPRDELDQVLVPVSCRPD